MLVKCVQAAEMLAKKGVKAEVIHLASIKPIDEDLIVRSVSKTGCAVTAENASYIGGFGDAVAEVTAKSYPVHLTKVGVPDKFIESGGIEELFAYYHMQPEDIAERALEVIKKKEKIKAVM